MTEKIWEDNLFNNRQILGNLRREAVTAISGILADWDGASAEQKVSAIEGIYCLLAAVEEGMAEGTGDDTGT